jgi:hypothetical protein
VVKDAWACSNAKTGLWELENVFYQKYCLLCDDETHFIWKWVEVVTNMRMRELNGRFPQQGMGTGSVVITARGSAEGRASSQKVVSAVQYPVAPASLVLEDQVARQPSGPPAERHLYQSRFTLPSSV